MSDTILEKRLRMLEVTYASALISFGVFTISAGSLQLDIFRYLFMVLGLVVMATPVLGLHRRIVKFVAARTGPSYITLGLFALPAGLVVPPLVLAFFLRLGVQSGITTPQENLLPFIGAAVMILINLGVLIYNVVESRRKIA